MRRFMYVIYLYTLIGMSLDATPVRCNSGSDHWLAASSGVVRKKRKKAPGAVACVTIVVHRHPPPAFF